MTGRGIDQVMAAPLPPVLHEPWVRDARDYVRLAERAHGDIAQPVAPDYPWGEALAEKGRLAPDLFIVNLETAVTCSGTPWPRKGIHYRMSPRHVDCLTRAGVDACTLANNHVPDWGHEGLRETLATLHAAGIACAGAGSDAKQAEAPAVLPLPGGARLLLFAWATQSSGVPSDWRAGPDRPGVALLTALDEADVQTVPAGVQRHRHPGDRVVLSLHWGGNWVDEVPVAHRRFAHRLIELDAVDVVHGHSSHHPLPFEVYAGRPILYGTGDLINDYEGIARQGPLRSDIGCLYAVRLARSGGRLLSLHIVPLQLRRFRLARPEPEALRGLRGLLDEGGRALGTRLEDSSGPAWRLAWG
jgi:poly-gamma-glutamate synthesis protein (capsule biosynthesis protein)